MSWSKTLRFKARSSKLGIGQRAAIHCSSQTDNDEAFMAGMAAVKAAVSGETDKMVILVRAEGENYQCETSLAPLSEIANGVKEIPEDWIFGRWYKHERKIHKILPTSYSGRSSGSFRKRSALLCSTFQEKNSQGLGPSRVRMN